MSVEQFLLRLFQKNIQKILKKLLTNEMQSDIMVSVKSGKHLEVKRKISKFFKKVLDKCLTI